MTVACSGRWDAALDRLPGTIDNLTAVETRRAHAQLGLPTSEEHVGARVAQFCKLFLGARGATTRFHQDNFHAHAWLSQVLWGIIYSRNQLLFDARRVRLVQILQVQ